MKVIKTAMQCNVNENLEMKNSLRSIFFAARDQSYLRKETSFSFVSIFFAGTHIPRADTKAADFSGVSRSSESGTCKVS